MTFDPRLHYQLVAHIDRYEEKSVTTTLPNGEEVLTSYNVPVFVPYMGQLIPGADVPTEIYGYAVCSKSLKTEGKFIIAVNAIATDVIDIVKTYGREDWILKQIAVINAHNKNIKSQASVSTRDFQPPPDDIIIDRMKWDFMLGTLKLSKYPILMGPTGAGKTVIARALAQTMGYDYYYLNAGSLFKPKSTLVGTVQANEGSTYLVQSEFMTYYSSEKPTIIFIDEISRIPQGASNMMVTILDREQSYIYVEELAKRIYKGKDVMFIAAANFGIQYVDTRKLDSALMNRFMPFYVDYLNEDDEIRLVNLKVPGLNSKTVKDLVSIATKLRRNFDTLGEVISHRHVIDLAGYIKIGFTLNEIVSNLLVNMFISGNEDKREEAEQIING